MRAATRICRAPRLGVSPRDCRVQHGTSRGPGPLGRVDAREEPKVCRLSPLERAGFELPVRGHGESGCRSPFVPRRVARHTSAASSGSPCEGAYGLHDAKRRVDYSSVRLPRRRPAPSRTEALIARPSAGFRFLPLLGPPTCGAGPVGRFREAFSRRSQRRPRNGARSAN